MMTPYEIYQQYNDKGFQLITLGNDKKPKKLRKLTKGGCSKHSVKPSESNTNMKLAIVPPNNIMIIDVDVKDDKVGLDSLERLQDDLFIEFEHNVITGSGGIHIYVEIDRPYKIEQKDYPDIDFICYKPDKNTCTPYAVAGGQTITFEGKDYVYDLLSTKIQSINGLDEVLEENIYNVKLDDDMIAIDDLYSKKTREEVIDLLSWVDANDYHEWVANCAAIKNELGNTEEAFNVFHEWSKSADNYSSREDCLSKWKSIDNQHNNPRTMGTIYMNALQNKIDKFISGLKDLDPDDSHELYQFLKKDIWKNNPIFNDNIVYNDLAKAVSNYYSYDLNKSKRTLKEVGLHKDVSDISETVMAEIVDDNPFSHYVKSTAFTRNNIYNILTGERLGDTELADRHHRDLIKIQNRLGLKKAFTIRHVFQKQMIPVVSFNEYNPMTTERIFTNSRGAKVLNLFDPSTVPTESAETEEGTKLIRKFIRHLEILTTRSEASVLLDWMAYITQNQGKKVLWVPMIQSVEGVGKSLIGNLLINHVFGPSNAGIVDSVIIADKNNSWASSKILRVLEEIKLSGHNRYEVLNQLKPLITNPTITRVEKFEVSSEVRNTCNFIAFTNYKDALPVDDTDRRWWIVFSSIDDLDHLERRVGKSLHDYFSPLHDLARESSPYGPEFKTFLLNRDLSSFNPNFPPESKHKEELAEIERSKIDGMEELYHLLMYLYKEDYPKSDYPKVIDVREIKLASEMAVDDNGSRISKDMKIKDIKYILKKMKYIQIHKKDAYNPDWSGISPVLYHRPTTTLNQAVAILKDKTNKDVISQQFDDIDDL